MPLIIRLSPFLVHSNVHVLFIFYPQAQLDGGHPRRVSISSQDDAPYGVDVMTAPSATAACWSPVPKICKCMPCVGCGRVFKSHAGLCSHHRHRPECDLQCERWLESGARLYEERCESIISSKGCHCRDTGID